MSYDSIEPHPFLGKAAQAFEMFGLDVDPTTAQYLPTIFWGASGDISIQDRQGEFTAFAHKRRSLERYDQLGILSTPRGVFDFNGLLRHETGVVEVLERYSPPTLVEVEVISSVEVYNRTVTSLGGTPGVDAFKWVTTPIEEKRAGQFLERVVALEVPAKEAADRLMHTHDLDLYSHVGYAGVSPEIILALAQTGKGIKSKYGDKIHLPDAERPKVTVDFSKSVDSLHTYTLPFMRLAKSVFTPGLSEYGTRPVDQPSPTVRAWSLVNGELSDYSSEQRLIATLRIIGALRSGLHKKEMQRELTRLSAGLMVHAAIQRKNLEEIRPTEGLSPRFRQSQTAVLCRMIEVFSEVAAA